jgi:HTH-type transcriptional regulator/antitoxin HigA
MIQVGEQAALDDATDEYLALVRAFPLVHIRDDAQYQKALAVMWPLVESSVRSDAQEAYLGALTDLIEIYDNAHTTFPPRTGLDALRSLIEENGLRQEDLLDIFKTQSVVSEVLRGKRKLTLRYIKDLAAFFHVAPATFLDGEPL